MSDQILPVDLVWITPDAEQLLVHMARVSNPAGQQKNVAPERLLQYLKDHKHWSPFEMVSACFEINTTRDIAHQIIRHRSFSFQEFSQRYAATSALSDVPAKEARMQDTTNRQHSIETDSTSLHVWWERQQKRVLRTAQRAYQDALKLGIAKECARVVLPEGLTATRLYMTGTIRSWLHYLDQRCDIATQKEHRQIALAIEEQLRMVMPVTFNRRRKRQTK